jgi:hypothetical protein
MSFGEAATVVFWAVASAIGALWCAAVLACAAYIAVTLAADVL